MANIQEQATNVFVNSGLGAHNDEALPALGKFARGEQFELTDRAAAQLVKLAALADKQHGTSTGDVYRAVLKAGAKPAPKPAKS